MFDRRQHAKTMVLTRWRKHPPLERFWARVVKKDSKSCWLWRGSKKPDGYGFMHVNKHFTLASHLSWEIANGKSVPRGLFVLHRCDNPQCVNPRHLFIGNQKDNVRDCWSKNRHPRVSTAVKLTPNDVRLVRRLWNNGLTQKVIGEKIGIDQSEVSRIVNGERWPHIT